jgi:1-acyl-sn-glycerol-3-phosphate acyltransferase
MPAPRPPSFAAAVPGQSPRRRWAQRLLEACGWRFDLPAPPAPKAILIVYPHTSNWDFAWGILTLWGSGWPVRWLAKHTLFVGPVGWLFRRWGGIAVNRAAPEGFADALVEEIRRTPALLLAITPEGTRSYRDHWKSGFYRIARATGLPIGTVYIDYATRTVGVAGYFAPGGDAAADLARIAADYAGKVGRRPENAAPIRFGREG